MLRRSVLPAMAAGLCCRAAEPLYKPLFNGKDLTGWIVDTPGLWSVRDGAIVGKHRGLKYNDFLRTERSYGNFVLRAKLRLLDNVGNTGIQFRTKGIPGSHEVAGYQADAGEKYWGCLYDESRRKRILGQASAESLAGLDTSGWNQYVISADGDRITLELNGKRTVDYREEDPAVERSGFIALQVHSGPGIEVHFKDIEIREMK